MSRKTIGLMLGAAVAVMTLAPAPVLASGDKMRSGEMRMCMSPGFNCRGSSTETFALGGLLGHVVINVSHVDHDEERRRTRFRVEIGNNTSCRLYVPGMFVTHGDNRLALDPGGIWVEPRRSRESSVKEFGFDADEMDFMTLKYTLSLSDCEG